jgi:hypothetical protein
VTPPKSVFLVLISALHYAPGRIAGQQWEKIGKILKNGDKEPASVNPSVSASMAINGRRADEIVWRSTDLVSCRVLLLVKR